MLRYYSQLRLQRISINVDKHSSSRLSIRKSFSIFDKKNARLNETIELQLFNFVLPQFVFSFKKALKSFFLNLVNLQLPTFTRDFFFFRTSDICLGTSCMLASIGGGFTSRFFLARQLQLGCQSCERLLLLPLGCGRIGRIQLAQLTRQISSLQFNQMSLCYLHAQFQCRWESVQFSFTMLYLSVCPPGQKKL